MRYALSLCCLSAGLLGSGLLAGQAEAVPAMWTVTPSPNHGSGGDQLQGVSCAGPGFCMAVGSYLGGARTLAETWNGTVWSITPSPSPGGDPDELLGVSCTSSSFCMAVGWHYKASAERYVTLVEAWDGKAWSIVPSPSRSVQSLLYSVSCAGPRSCQAVGYFVGRTGTLAESWNGTAWSVTPSPAGGVDGVLQAVSCVSATRCVAVGSYDNPQGGSNTLAEFWNGHRWSVVPSADPGGPAEGNLFTGVSCTSARQCDAVGYYGPPFHAHTLTESWNGSRWSVVPSPDRGTVQNFLDGVSCVSSSSCVATGYNFTRSGDDNQELVESWNGSRWSITATPHPGADQQVLGVTCTGAVSCEVVGYYGDGALISDKTLVETGS